jgi:uncharacterized protein (DUF2249 family)/quercetin dioxygenase-like cupin family protein
MSHDVLDVRPVRKPDKHPTIFAAFQALERGESFVLVNNHDPVHLREEFESEHPGGYGWDYLENGPTVWRIEIRKLTTTPLPRLLADTTSLTAAGSDTSGAVWKLETRERDLDANVIHLPPTGTIGRHAGPDLDVLVHVLAGSGDLTTEMGTLSLTPGALAWLPRRSHRQFTAGPEGLTYLTVHQRRQALTLTHGTT